MMSELVSGAIIAIGSDKDTDTPSAWVGCLGCYNSGALVGKWIPGSECNDLEAAGLTNSAGACIKCGADEFWVMDHENFGSVLSGECSPMEAYDAAILLESVEDYEREQWEAWLSNGMPADIDTMRECYIGEFSNDEELGEYMVDECGLLNDMPESLRGYFDYAKYGRDLAYDTFEAAGHYFWSH